MGLSEFESQIQELGTEFAAYTTQRESLFRHSRPEGISADDIVRAGTHADTQLSDAYDELHLRLDELCATYLAMREREQARELVGMFPDLLRQLTNHLGWSVRNVQIKDGRNHLMRGLAAVSLGDLRADVRDLLVAIGGAYLRCYRAGVFMSVPLARVAELSNPLPRPPGITSTRDFLLNFEQSAYFVASVSPNLR